MVEAATALGAAYALWGLAWDLGVRWLHPEETFTPSAPDALLAWDQDGRPQRPDFALRGFHEHTQHPIPLSDTLLRPDFPGGRAAVSRELRWLARNRQNILTFHLLNTVDLDTWLPYVRGVADEARGLGIDLGVVVSFADQQQHAFKLIHPEATDRAGQPIPAEQQIADGLDRVLDGGFRHVGLQFGTSEFTAPDRQVALGWLDSAVAHLAATHPDVTAHAWVHITCGLETDGGAGAESFFHLPLDADPRLGAFVHTTMFYTLTDPAPVYGCHDFSHQAAFIDAAEGTRQLTFYPESAWWLGFDDNLPLLLPLTGWSRAADIARVKGHVSGHVTFTTGREWTYWQYDHFVARAGWDASLGWDDYLAAIAPSYGEHGPLVREVLSAWTALERRDFFDTNPSIYFYLAGELPQDELGAAAGVLARQPKVPFIRVRDMDDAAFASWKRDDYDLLGRMRDDYAALLARLPEAPAAGAAADRDGSLHRYRELRRAATLFVARIDQTLALYGGAALRAADRPAAEAKLAEARRITAAARVELGLAEADYRDPIAWLARPKPDSLTVYPFGYLYETSTAYFWTRRDDQLAALVTATFDGALQRWPAAPLGLFRAPAETTTLVEPDDPVATNVLGGFVPGILVGAMSEVEGGLVQLALAADRDGNALPDEEPLALTAAAGDRLTATIPAWVLTIHDQADQAVGNLVLRDATLDAEATVAAGRVTALPALTLSGAVESAELMALIRALVGIDEDGLATLIKTVWHLDASAPLPERLPFALSLAPEPVALPAADRGR
ncbi:MAG: hypothetical protein U1F43_25535 [Myxococcota bacterium]